jgi:hypothetical protein
MGVRDRLAEAGAFPADIADGSHIENSLTQCFGALSILVNRPRFDPTT